VKTSRKRRLPSGREATPDDPKMSRPVEDLLFAPELSERPWWLDQSPHNAFTPVYSSFFASNSFLWASMIPPAT